MQFRAIKRGKMVELPEELNIPDGQEIIVNIQECQLMTSEERQQKIKEFLETPWEGEDFIKTMQELEKEKNEQWEKFYGQFHD
jgi:hypothetical protein